MKIKSGITKITVVGLVVAMMLPGSAQAAGVTNRSTTLGSSAASATTSYAVSFRVATAGTVGSIKFEICDSPVKTTACAGTGNSAGASLAGATLSGPTGTNWTGGTWGSGGTTGPGAAGTSIKFTNSGTAVSPTTSDQGTWTLNNVINPSATNKSFYVRVTTYSDTGYVTEVDYGGMAVSTSQQITVTGTMPESLVFCVGTTWNTNCNDISGTTVSLGTFSPTGTNTGTSVMAASTNASSGYVITINGTTMTSGLNTIPAMGNQVLNDSDNDPSVVGTSQFGTNVVANATPSVGANVTPTGAGYNGAGTGGYNTANNFRFFTGDRVASSASPTNSQVFTNSYMVNVAGSQAAGVYTSTLTYICTATF